MESDLDLRDGSAFMVFPPPTPEQLDELRRGLEAMHSHGRFIAMPDHPPVVFAPAEPLRSAGRVGDSPPAVRPHFVPMHFARAPGDGEAVVWESFPDFRADPPQG